MFNQRRQNYPVARGLAGSRSGDTYTGISYGDDHNCPKCRQKHPIYETQVVYDVCRLILQSINYAQPMMIGVLRDNNERFYAACSPADRTPGQVAFRNAIQNNRRILPQINLVGNLPLNLVKSRGEEKLGAKRIRSCTVNGQPIAGRCAAPKLIYRAITNSLPRPWSMSEVMHDPNNQNPNYGHFVTAQSCLTCQNLLPLMLCTHSRPQDLITFTGLIRRHWGNNW